MKAYNVLKQIKSNKTGKDFVILTDGIDEKLFEGTLADFNRLEEDETLVLNWTSSKFIYFIKPEIRTRKTLADVLAKASIEGL